MMATKVKASEKQTKSFLFLRNAEGTNSFKVRVHGSSAVASRVMDDSVRVLVDVGSPQIDDSILEDHGGVDVLSRADNY